MQFKNLYFLALNLNTLIVLSFVFMGSISCLSQNTTENPFIVKHTGLPYRAPSCGNGMPSRISPKLAQEVIEEVFAEEGVLLQKNYAIEKEGVKLIVNGYNEQLKIGYVWMNAENLVQGNAYVTEMDLHYYSNNNNTDSQQRVLQSFHRTYENLERFLQRLRKSNVGQKYVEQFEKIYSSNRPFSKKDSLKIMSIYLNHSLDFNIKRFHYQENIVSLGKSIIQIKKLDKKLEQYARFTDLLSLMHSIRYGSREVGENALQFAIDQIEALNSIEWEALVEDLLVVTIYSYRKDVNSEIFNDIEQSFDLPDVEKQQYWAKIIEISDKKTISLEEIKHLENFAENLRQDFIAPISQYDRRFSYSGYNSREFLKILAKKGVVTDDIYAEKRKEKLEELKTCVQEYIRWAKQQQRF